MKKGSTGLKCPIGCGAQPCSLHTSKECQSTDCSITYKAIGPEKMCNMITGIINRPCTNTIDPLEVKAESLYQKFERELLKQEQEKEHAMRATIDTTTDSSLNYIKNRLSQIYYARSDEINGMFREECPKTIKEGREWLEKGNYRIEKPKWLNEDHPGYNALEFFQWGRTAPDYAKRDALNTDLKQAYQAAVDEVTIITDEKARLKVLKEFEAYKI